MSLTGEIELPLGSETYKFRLRLGNVRKIEEKCGAGIPVILGRLHPLAEALRAGLPLGQILTMGLLGSWRVDDVREPIYQGLEGGGMAASMANALMAAEVDKRSPIESALLAYEIMVAYLTQGAEEPLGEPQAPEKPAQKRKRRSRTAAPDGPTSSAGAPS